MSIAQNQVLVNPNPKLIDVNTIPDTIDGFCFTPIIGDRALSDLLKSGYKYPKDKLTSRHCRHIPNIVNNGLRLLGDEYGEGKVQIWAKSIHVGMVVISSFKKLNKTGLTRAELNKRGDVDGFAKFRSIGISYSGFSLPGGVKSGRIYCSIEDAGLLSKITDNTGIAENDLLLAAAICGLATEDVYLHDKIRNQFLAAFKQFALFVERQV